MKDLFQFNRSDLDFGLYRILNYKREVIGAFIEQELPEFVEGVLREGTLAEQVKATEDFKKISEEIKINFGIEAIDMENNLGEPFHSTPLGQKYLKLRNIIGMEKGYQFIEANIYNHLYTFFSRYYQDGDFFPRRRYSRRRKFVVPYNGEEIYLHWANSDQYYVKTSEYFQEYSFTSHGVTVSFRIEKANIEQENMVGDRRYFVPQVNGIIWDSNVNLVVIPFEYRPLSTQEELVHGRNRAQEKILNEAEFSIRNAISVAEPAKMALEAERHKDGNGLSVSNLTFHLRQYTRRNNTDFFIHKDLLGFLSGELDFYLKNEVLNLDDLEAEGEELAAGWFQTVSLVKTVGGRIIDFLHQIQSFQKMLWEKRKFVTESNYCITVGTVDESFLPKIAECEPQWEEWQVLLRIEEESNLLNSVKRDLKDRIEYLKEHPLLLLDTKYFDQEFKDRLLSSFADLDGMIDGLLIHSENFQALSFLKERFQDQIDVIYIDPPYNSKTTEILYKNDYRHSTWLTLMENRLALSKKLASAQCPHIVAIDENEQELLGQLLSSIFPDHEKVCISVIHNKKGIQGVNFSYNHEYAYFCIPPALTKINKKSIPMADWEYSNLRNWGSESLRRTSRNCFYPIYVQDGEIVGFGEVSDEDFHPDCSNVHDFKNQDRIAIYPVDKKGVERKWRYQRNTVEDILPLLRVHITPQGEIQIQKAVDEIQFKTTWTDSKYIAGDHGTKWLTNLGLRPKGDLYPKSIYTVEDSVIAVESQDCRVLDYFAGSGTTGHAVINLNRQDGNRRKMILIEMGAHFDTVLLPRIKKVTFSPEWKDGRPKRMATKEEAQRSPRIFKYLRLESYEDTLNNISFDQSPIHSISEFEDYLVKYMLSWETRHSETLLSVDKLNRPFSFKVKTQRNGQTVTALTDIPETFNYLLGLHVQKRLVYDDGGRHYLVYKGLIADRRIVVIWRETENWGKDDWESDRDFAEELGLANGADEVYVNNDSLIPYAKALDPLFKARMFAPLGV